MRNILRDSKRSKIQKQPFSSSKIQLSQNKSKTIKENKKSECLKRLQSPQPSSKNMTKVTTTATESVATEISFASSFDNAHQGHGHGHEQHMHNINTDDDVETKSITFEHIEYDMTDIGCQTFLCLTCPLHFLPVVPSFMGKKTMILEEEEAVLAINCQPFCNIETRRPYGELGSVDQTSCLCCTGVSSNLSKSMPLFPGCGCEYSKVGEIVQELKRRMKARGDTGQIAKTEEALKELHELRVEMKELKVDMKLLLDAMKVPSSSSTTSGVNASAPMDRF